MSKTLTFEVPDELYEAFEQVAARSGRTTEAVALEWLAQRAATAPPKLSEEERKKARERFMRHIGASSLSHPTGVDNESIDADLAREYESTHEEA